MDNLDVLLCPFRIRSLRLWPNFRRHFSNGFIEISSWRYCQWMTISPSEFDERINGGRIFLLLNYHAIEIIWGIPPPLIKVETSRSGWNRGQIWAFASAGFWGPFLYSLQLKKIFVEKFHFNVSVSLIVRMECCNLKNVVTLFLRPQIIRFLITG